MSRYYPPVTVTGNPVNFSAPNGGKLDSVSVQIIPTQDLHGYANPWPGGGGTNLLGINRAEGTPSPNSVIVSPRVLATDKLFPGLRADNYYYSGYITDYSVTDSTIKVTTTNNINYGVAFPVACHGNTAYTLSATLTGCNMSVGSYDADWNFIQRVKSTSSTTPVTFTTPANAAYITVIFGSSTLGTEGTATNIQLELGSTATSWTPYSNICPISGLTGLSVYVSPTQDQDDATVYNVDWSTQAGTVYGGTVDVVTGVLTVNRYTQTFVGTESYTNYTSVIQCNETLPVGISVAGSDILCSHSTNQYVHFSNSSKNKVQFDKATFGVTSVDELKAKLSAWNTAGTPLQYSYDLATPLTYQLTPKQIAALIDQNYIWSSNNETISVVYALLVPGSDKYTLIVNGVDIADFVERDSYRTTLYPVFSEAVQTLDGVGHTALLRKKGELSARFNPRTAADTAIICAALLNAPCEVQYHCLQRNADVTALMTIDSVSALYLSRCLYCRQKWNDIDSITLTEL